MRHHFAECLAHAAVYCSRSIQCYVNLHHNDRSPKVIVFSIWVAFYGDLRIRIHLVTRCAITAQMFNMQGGGWFAFSIPVMASAWLLKW